MKISNWCILFSVLFCGMILYTDLRFRYTMEAQYTMEEYNRIFDRAADDALTDQLQEEYWDGSLKIDEEKVQNRFFEQTAYVLDLTGETEKENLKELVLLRKLVKVYLWRRAGGFRRRWRTSQIKGQSLPIWHI